mmetsp:Transcript_13025/g.19011  ORF Transcript_13025/g.19011 Transcript_13025/m.19011 type:complete len:204 (-) Transcript_13025:189-800(-)
MTVLNKDLQHDSKVSPTYVKASLWVMPPKEIAADLADKIKSHAERYSLPAFAPHVTLVGGIRIQESQFEEAVGKLSNAFSHQIDPINCNFIKSKGVVAGLDKDTGLGMWTQSAIAVMKRDETFLKAVAIAREALGMPNDENIIFAAPLREPHLSLAYAYTAMADSLQEEFPPDFVSNEFILMRTDPMSVEGVDKWEEIGRINL